MRIGELAGRTGVSTRLLRYYEEQGLLVPDRAPNGYRDYGEALVDRVIQIRGLLDSGLPTRIIAQVLPCLAGPRDILFADATPELIATLEREREQMDTRIRCLTRNRDAISAYLDAVRDQLDPPEGPGSSSASMASTAAVISSGRRAGRA